MAMEHNFTGRTALVVEDIDSSRKGYVANLKAIGFDVEEADRVETAVRKLQRKRFDLAWVDLGLEDTELYTSLAGKEVVGFIRRLADPTFVLVVTVISDADTAVELIRSIGADDYLTKDKLTTSTPNELINRIRLGLKRYENERRVNLSSVEKVLFGSQGEQGFYGSLAALYRPSTPAAANLVHSVLNSMLDRAWPLLPLKDRQNHFSAEASRLTGVYWSRRLGHAVSLEFMPTSNDTPGANVISTFERGKVHGAILRNNRPRDEFVESTQ